MRNMKMFVLIFIWRPRVCTCNSKFLASLSWWIYCDIDDHVRVERAWCAAKIISSVETWYVNGQSTSVRRPCQTVFPGVSWCQWQLSWAVLKIIDQCSHCWLQLTASKNRFSVLFVILTVPFCSIRLSPVLPIFSDTGLNVSNIFEFSGISRKIKNPTFGWIDRIRTVPAKWYEWSGAEKRKSIHVVKCILTSLAIGRWSRSMLRNNYMQSSDVTEMFHQLQDYFYQERFCHAHVGINQNPDSWMVLVTSRSVCRMYTTHR